MRHDGIFPSKDKTMKELDTCNDRVIAFWAVRKSDIQRPGENSAPRQPLQPCERHVSQQRILSPVAASDAAPYPKSSIVLNDRVALGIKSPRSVDHPHLPKSSYLTQNENVLPTNLPASSVAKAAKFIHYHAPSPSLFPWNSPGPLMYEHSRFSPESVQAQAAQVQNAPFLRYLADFRVHFFEKGFPASGVPADEGLIQFQAWDAWEKLTDDQRASYYNPKHSAFSAESSLMQMPDVGYSTSLPSGPNMSLDQQPIVPPTPNKANLALKEEDASDLDFKDQFTYQDDLASQTEMVHPQSFHLQNIIADASLDVLEASVERGVKFLDDLKFPLVERLESSPDAAQWVQQIERLQKQAVRTKTVIGVVGNTGAGKSSVINAMLDEERLV